MGYKNTTPDRVYFPESTAYPNVALAEYEAWQKRLPIPVRPFSFPLTEAIRLYIGAEAKQVSRGTLAPRSLNEIRSTLARLTEIWGADKCLTMLRPEDFQQYMSARETTCGLVAMGNEITRVKGMFIEAPLC